MEPQNPALPFPEITTREAFGQALQALNTTGWTYRDLMDKCRASGAGLDHRTIGTWFTGSNLPSRKLWDDFRILLGHLGVYDEQAERWIATARKVSKARNSGDVVPYRGLDSYGTQDAPYFFGRDTLVRSVLSNLRELHETGGGALLVVGSSGAGKTSLLQAGVRPALAAGDIEGSAEWSVLSFAATPAPLTGLARTLADRSDQSPEDVAADLRANPNRAAYHLDRIHPLTPAPVPRGRGVLVIVDQVEQALIADREQPTRELTGFLTALEAITAGPGGAIVVLGLRADQYGAAQDNLRLQALTRGRQVSVTPMDDHELRAVIAEPAVRNGVVPEAGFVELVMREVTARTDRTGHHTVLLPQLSHALRTTWLAGGGSRMTVQDYRDAGGLDRAITDTAESVFTRLNEVQRSIARKLFCRLVLLHPAAADTRRQARLGELSDEGHDADLYEVLYRFASPGLLTVEAETVEITHESLIFTWKRLRRWLDTDRAGRLLAQRLAEDAAEWEDHGRDPDRLYQGTRLHSAREWVDEHPDESSRPVQAFLQAGVHRSRRRTRRLQQVIGLLTVLLLAVAGLAGVVVAQERAASRERDEAVSRMIASRTVNLRGVDVSLSRQLALAAYRISPTVEARSALIDATALRPAIRMRVDGDTKTMYAVAHHPTAPVVAVGLNDSLLLWSVEDPGHPSPLPPPPSATCARINALAFHPDGDLLVAGCRDQRLLIWDTTATPPVAVPAPDGLGGNVRSVAFNTDGTLLAAAISETTADQRSRGTIRLWRVTADTLTPLGEALTVDQAPAKSVAFHPDGHHLAVGTASGAVQIWDIRDPARPTDPVTATGPTKEIGQLAFSSDGHHLAASGADARVHLWDSTDPRNVVAAGDPIDGAESWTNAVAFSPDSTKFAVASSDASVGARVYDTTTRALLATMPHPSAVTSVKFTPDGRDILTGANDGVTRLWPVDAPALPPTSYLVSSTRFSPDSRILAVGSADLRLYDLADPQRPRLLGPAITNTDGFAGALAFSPDSRVLAESHGRSGTVQLHDLTDPAQPKTLGPPLVAHQGQVEHLSFNPAGTVMATGGRDGAVHLWNISRPEAPTRLSTPGTFGGYVHWTAFSHDGTMLVAGSSDRTLRIWDITHPDAPRQLGTPPPANHYVYSTVFSPDGTILAVSLGDSTVHLYDMTDPTHPARIGTPLTGPIDYAYSVAFTDDGTTLAGAYNDGTIWIWDIRDRTTPLHLATLTLPAKQVFTIQFRPGHTTLAAGGGDKIPRVWTTDIDQAAAQVCRSTGTPITPEEWARYVPDHDYQPPCD
ncbi:WD40 repeat protein [Saccharothrix saharensis]|uniref:WD40 repeat protein n=1 Tax=Saccharothrix saharensis TaxID=571190 RepID=A0A543JG28_9PSEU|nr:WD40 repeat domain-containing protein [Saccharothrix saharensis]TQM81766.1 WD40 repeat protein [Saccharothrix saharensis]